jgi:thiamine biosynthesis protein ThiS
VRLRINGQERELPEGSTVADLLVLLELPKERVAVERNGAIAPRADYAGTRLSEGDVLEVVQFVGGG